MQVSFGNSETKEALKTCNLDPKAPEPIDSVPKNWANTSVGITIGTLTQIASSLSTGGKSVSEHTRYRGGKCVIF